jgi:hypothetical protein
VFDSPRIAAVLGTKLASCQDQWYLTAINVDPAVFSTQVALYLQTVRHAPVLKTGFGALGVQTSSLCMVAIAALLDASNAPLSPHARRVEKGMS